MMKSITSGHFPLNLFPMLSGVLKETAIVFILIIFSSNLNSQQTVSGIPFSSIYQVSGIEKYEVMPAFRETRSLKSQDSDRLKRLQFAHVFELALTPENSGEWITTGDGNRIWRIGLTSAGAFSLNLIFGTFRLEPNIRVYVYTPDQQYILGAYSSFNNNASGTLAIEPLAGDSMVIEINVPSPEHSYGEIEITRLGHDFLNILGSRLKSLSGASVSGACNMDVNCDAGLAWQREKYAVCKLIVNARDLCTGTLINNTAKDEMPYIITAHHCIDTMYKANATVFIFNYEKWKCGGENGPRPVSLSGSQLIATTPYLDFSLVKMYALPPFSVQPYFIGWDRSGKPPLNTVTIHHPNGDFKKISVDVDPAISSTFQEDYNPNTHWLINKWETGTTERGSSGAPLLNQNHLFIGDLTGGDATCAAPYRDYFAKFSNSWADYAEWKRQLKHWLDPLNSDSTSIRGLDPYSEEKASCDTFLNLGQNETLRLYNNNLNWGSYSGHNSMMITQFAEKINQAGTLKIPGFYLHVSKAYNALPLSYITIKLWKGGTIPGNEITSRSVYLRDLTVNKLNYLEFDSTIFVSGPVFLGYSVNYSAPQDTFALYQSENRGDTGYSGMFLYQNGQWKNISEITSPAIYSSLAVGLISCSLLNSLPGEEIRTLKPKVYPNPVVSGMLTVELPFAEGVTVSVYDLSGRQVQADFQLQEDQLTVNTSGLYNGIYILKILVPGKGMYNAKFMVTK